MVFSAPFRQTEQIQSSKPRTSLDTVILAGLSRVVAENMNNMEIQRYMGISKG